MFILAQDFSVLFGNTGLLGGCWVLRDKEPRAFVSTLDAGLHTVTLAWRKLLSMVHKRHPTLEILCGPFPSVDILNKICEEKRSNGTRSEKGAEEIDIPPHPRLTIRLIVDRYMCSHNPNQISATDAEARVLAARNSALAEELAMEQRSDAGRKLREQNEEAVKELSRSLEQTKRSRKDMLAASLKVYRASLSKRAVGALLRRATKSFC